MSSKHCSLSQSDAICEASLFFQNANNNHLCQRKLLLHQTPILNRHDALWAYFFPEQQPLTLRCPNHENQSCTLSLHGPGLILNLSACYITSTNLRTLPEWDHYKQNWKYLAFTYPITFPQSPTKKLINWKISSRQTLQELKL